MAVAKELMSVEEYLQTSFEGPDCDYVDGEVLERNMGELLHGDLQLLLAMLLRNWPGLAMRVVPEIRIQITQSRYRVADLGVWVNAGQLGQKIPPIPPFLAIEILSPEDRVTRLHARVLDYLKADVQFVWVIDPYIRQALVYSQEDPAGRNTPLLATANPEIRIELADLLSKLPEA